MSRTRRIGAALLALIALLAILTLGLGAVLSSERGRAWIAAQGRTALGVRIAIHGAVRPTFTAWKPGIALRDVEFGVPDSVPYLRAERMAGRIDFRRLVAGFFELDRFALDGVEAVVAVGRGGDDPSDEGAPDYASLLGRLPERTRARDLALELRFADGDVWQLLVDHASIGRCGDGMGVRGALNDAEVIVQGTLGCPGGAVLALGEARARIAESDVTGDLQLDLVGRPHLSGALRSEQLALADLAAARGVDPGDDEQGGAGLLDTKLAVKALRPLDLQLDLEVERLVTAPTTLEQVRARLELDEGRLALSLEEGRLWQGRIYGDVALDATAVPPRFAVSGATDDVSVAAFEGVEADGAFDVELEVESRGATPREILARLSGNTRLVLEPTELRGQPLGPLGRSLFDLLFSSFERAQRGVLNCGVLLTHFEDGLGESGAFLDTPDATLGGTGAIDLRRLEADLLLRPAPKGTAVVALNTPIRVRGPIDALEVGLDRSAAAADTSFVMLLGAVSPALSVVPLGDEEPSGGENPCEVALARAAPESFERKGRFGRSADRAKQAAGWVRNRVPRREKRAGRTGAPAAPE